MIVGSADEDKARIVICAGTACQASGANSIMRIAKKHIMEQGLIEKIALRITGCHGFCEMGPFILTEPQKAFYTQVKLEDVPRIIDAVLAGEYVEELLYQDPATGERYYSHDDIPFFKNQQRALLEMNQKIDPIRIYNYIGAEGYRALECVLAKRDPTRPFFIWVSHLRPHSPYDPPQFYWDMYNNADIPEPPIGDCIVL